MPTTASRAGTRASALPPAERRRAIVEACTPLLLAHGESVTTRQIAEAAGIAEGTIFRVFPDKEAVISAIVEAALDTEPLESDLAGIDASAPLEQRLEAAVSILQDRVVSAWRLLSALGPKYTDVSRRPMAESAALVALLRPDEDRLAVPATRAARILRSLTLSLTHPMLTPEPLTANQIVDLFLHGTTGATSC